MLTIAAVINNAGGNELMVATNAVAPIALPTDVPARAFKAIAVAANPAPKVSVRPANLHGITIRSVAAAPSIGPPRLVGDQMSTKDLTKIECVVLHIFTHSGAMNNIQDTFDRIFFKWLPDSRENFDEIRPVFCEHFNLQFKHIDESQLITKIYVPIS